MTLQCANCEFQKRQKHAMFPTELTFRVCGRKLLGTGGSAASPLREQTRVAASCNIFPVELIGSGSVKLYRVVYRTLLDAG